MPTTSDRESIDGDRVIVLRWLGVAWLPNIPARDLTDDDIQALVTWEKQYRELFTIETDDQGKPIDKPITARSIKAALVASGAYEAVEQPKAVPDVPAPKGKDDAKS